MSVETIKPGPVALAVDQRFMCPNCKVEHTFTFTCTECGSRILKLVATPSTGQVTAVCANCAADLDTELTLNAADAKHIADMTLAANASVMRERCK